MPDIYPGGPAADRTSPASPRHHAKMTPTGNAPAIVPRELRRAMANACNRRIFRFCAGWLARVALSAQRAAIQSRRLKRRPIAKKAEFALASRCSALSRPHWPAGSCGRWESSEREQRSDCRTSTSIADAAIERHVRSPTAWLSISFMLSRRAHRPVSLSTAISIPLWSILGGTVVRLKMVFAPSRPACVGRPAPLNGCNSCVT